MAATVVRWILFVVICLSLSVSCCVAVVYIYIIVLHNTSFKLFIFLVPSLPHINLSYIRLHVHTKNLPSFKLHTHTQRFLVSNYTYRHTSIVCLKLHIVCMLSCIFHVIGQTTYVCIYIMHVVPHLL